MKLSNTGMGTTKLNNIDEMYPGQSILLQTGQLVQYGAGIFAYNTIPLLVRRKVEQIIQETLNKYNCVEVLLPTLQPDTIWKNSGRYDAYVNDGTMLITESNKGTFCLAPTGEEAMLEFAKEKLKSYKNLPATYYQIGEKFRKEIRARGYLFRPRTFVMMDAYSFDKTQEDMHKTFEKMHDVYMNIFKRIGINIIPVVSDGGTMGGRVSEEFQAITKLGEDIILYNEEKNVGEFGWIINKQYWKKGYATEAALAIKDFAIKELKVSKLIATCDSRNSNSYKLMEKIGLGLESDNGTRTYPKNGETAKELMYSLIIK